MHWLVAALLLTAIAGCPAPREETKPGDSQHDLSGLTIRLGVVEDEPLAEAIRRLAGEWNAQTSSTLEVVMLAASDLAQSGDEAARVQVDAVIYPSDMLGALAERGVVRALPDSVVADPELDWGGVLDRLRTVEARWGQSDMAVPLGSSELVCFYRADLLDQLKRDPPRTWPEYFELAQLLAKGPGEPTAETADTGSWHAAVEATAEGWRATTFLARAAAYARHPSHYSALFDIESMQPLIAGPPFVRALEEMIAAMKLNADAAASTPDEVLALVESGKCGLAIGYVRGEEGGKAQRGAERSALPIRCAPLPGASQVYDPATSRWAHHEGDSARFVPLLATRGRLVSITAKTESAAAAERLLVWLSGSKWQRDISTASRATGPFRRSQLSQAADWMAPLGPAAPKDYASVIEEIQRVPDYLATVRLPGHDRYLKALDSAVGKALEGEAAAADALSEAAGEWGKITDELGVEPQRRAYRRSLGIEP